MAQMHGTAARSFDETVQEIRRVADAQGWAFAEAESTPHVLEFKKGMSIISWGSQLHVEVTSGGPTETGITVTTSETWSLADWGRGKRSAINLLEGVGATLI